MSVLFPLEASEIPGDAEVLAGGTDLGERLRHGAQTARLVDLRRIPGLRDLGVDDRGAGIGAMVTLDEVGAHPELRRRYPGLAEVCGVLATPQIRARATMGGALCQRTRCWYFRHPGFTCFKDGGDACPAREGENPHGVAFDRGPCVHPHPSSVGAALLTYDVLLDTSRRDSVPLEEFFGDGTDARRDHALEPGEILTRVRLEDPGAIDPAAYVRLMARELAEWPLVECVVRIRVVKGRIALARVAVGGVANTPLRLAAVEATLVGEAPTEDLLRAAAESASDGAAVLPGTRDKRRMLSGTVLEALEKAIGPV